MSLNNGEMDSELCVVRWLCLCANIMEYKYTYQTRMVTMSLGDITLQTVMHIAHHQLKNHYVVHECACVYKSKAVIRKKDNLCKVMW